MLFQTVYGPELESLYHFIEFYGTSPQKVSKDFIYSNYLPEKSGQGAGFQKGQSKNIDDALSYLRSCGLISALFDNYYQTPNLDNKAKLPFAVLILGQFRRLEQNQSNTLEPLDLLYINLLDRLFIQPNLLWINDVHSRANKLDLAREIGGIGQEKIGAWKRVMEYLGVGYRVGSGFYCLLQPSLLLSMIREWPQKGGSLQDLIYNHLHPNWLPCLNSQKDVSKAVVYSFDELERRNFISFQNLQDAPYRAFFGNRLVKGILLK